jgi:hypothetical protein
LLLVGYPNSDDTDTNCFAIILFDRTQQSSYHAGADPRMQED